MQGLKIVRWQRGRYDPCGLFLALLLLCWLRETLLRLLLSLPRCHDYYSTHPNLRPLLLSTFFLACRQG